MCGEFSAVIAGREVTGELPGRQGLAVFASLVLTRPGGLARGQLTDVLWPGAPPKSPERGLDVVISRLRTALGGGVLVGRAQLSLDLGGEALVDVELAPLRLEQAEAALTAGDYPASARAAHEGLDLIADPLLPRLEGAWLDAHRRRLAELTPRLLRTGARAGLMLGGAALDRALTDAQRLVAEHPYSESATALLMEIHEARGDVAEALRVYEDLRGRLLEHLGQPPSRVIAKLHARMLREEPPDVPAVAPEIPLSFLDATGEQSHFVGREPELAALRARWDGMDPERWPIVLLEGEPGIGKTMIAARFAQEVGGRGVLAGRCDEDPIVPFQPFVEAFRHPDALTGSAADEDVAALAPLMPHARSLAQGPGAGIAPEMQRYVMFEAVVERLCRWTRVRPLLLVLDDLHWADRPTVKLLQHLLRSRRPMRLMLLATYRGDEARTPGPFSDLLDDLRRARALELHRIKGLSRGETELLVRERLASAAEDFSDELWTRTDGNPLFIEEALRSIAASSRARAGAQVSAQTLTGMGVPAGVKSVIVRRLTMLPAEAAESLRTAAAIGQVFDPRLVADVRRIDVGRVLETLDHAPTRGLVAELDQYRYAFCHGIIRDAIYEDLSETRRADLHRRVGELLERSPERLGQAAEIASHFTRAGEHADPLRTAAHEHRAGDEAARAFAWEKATTHYERAAATLAALGPAHEHERCAVLLAWATSLARGGMSHQARGMFHEAASSALARGDARQLASAALGLGQRYWEANVDAHRDRTYRRRLEEALELLPASDSTPRVRLLARLAEQLAFVGRDGENPVAVSAQALAMARRVDDPRALITALMAHHTTLLHVEYAEERLALLDEVLELCAGRPELSSEARIWRIYDLCELGRMDEARAEQRRLSALAETLRQPLLRHVAIGWESVFSELAGDAATTERLAGEFFRQGERAQAYDARSTRAAKLFALHRWQGRLEELREDVEALAVGVIAVPAWRAALSLLRVLTGDAERGHELARGLVAELDRIPRDFFWVSAVGVTAESVAVLRDADLAEPLYDALAPYAARHMTHSFGACWGSAERPLGLLADLLGRPERAEQHLRAALDANRAIDAPMLVAITQCDYAEWLLRGGETARGRELGEAAYEAAQPLGLRVLTERAARLC